MSVFIHAEYPLKTLNTFGINVNAQHFVQLENMRDARLLLKNSVYYTPAIWVLGGGSNVLFLGDVEGLVVQPVFKSIEIMANTTDYVDLRVGAGVNWDDLVAYAVENGWGGLENLSYIPGSVGASPVQNIGAYGVEAKDTITSVETIDLNTFEYIDFTNEQCEFGYRSSIFKLKYKNRLVVTHVTFRLQKHPQFVLNYANIEERVKSKGSVCLKNVRETIIEVRQGKLPEPCEVGSAGSFLKTLLLTELLFKG